MSIHYKYWKLSYFFKREIWSNGSVPFDRDHWRICISQRLYVAFHGLFLKGHWMSAAQLTFNTLMAIIPVFAIVYAIASGFGFGDIIVNECRQTFSSQPVIAEAIVSLSKNYIHYTHTGVVLGISFVFMLYTVLSLFNNIEGVFNSIWGTAEDRNLGRMIVDYTSMLFIVPICVIMFSGLSVFFYSLIDYLPGYHLLTPFIKGAVQFLIPLILLTIFFIAAYVYIPNTKVKLRYVWLPSIIAAICILSLQAVFVHFQVLFTSYSIIYGSLAALPLLMLWLQLSWFIGIGCAELAHANQTIGHGNYYKDNEESVDTLVKQSAVILGILSHRQQRAGAPMTIKELLTETNFNYSSLRRCLKMLIEARLIHGNISEKTDDTDVFVLRREASSLRFGEMADAFLSLPQEDGNYWHPWVIKPDMQRQINVARKEFIAALNSIPIADCIEHPESK